MRLNNDQLKHIARIFDISALALLAPIFAEITNLKEIPDFSTLNLLLLAVSAAILEIGVIYILSKVK